MKHLIFYAPRINKDEFGKEARRFAKCHNVPDKDVIPVSTFQPLMMRRWKIFRELKKREGTEYDSIVFFCHGWKHKLQLVGKEVSIPAFARRLSKVTGEYVTVVLYACNCAATNGFAQRIRDELYQCDCDVIGHSTPGHTTRNPYVRCCTKRMRFRKRTFALVYRGTDTWIPWRKHLRKDKDFRFRFPFMSPEQIAIELDSIE